MADSDASLKTLLSSLGPLVEATTRLNTVNEAVQKFDPDQARDESGKWTEGGSGGGSK